MLVQVDAGIVIERDPVTLTSSLLQEWLPTQEPPGEDAGRGHGGAPASTWGSS